MFLAAITNVPICHLLKHLNAFEIECLPRKNLTIIGDGFNSDWNNNDNLVTIIEPSLQKLMCSGFPIFSKIVIDKKNLSLDIFKFTISGRFIYYYLNDQGEFFCASHISLLRQAGVEITENSDALPEYFVYRYVMPPQTLYKNIYQVPTGSHIKFHFDTSRFYIASTTKYNPPIQDVLRDADISNIATKTLEIIDNDIKILEPVRDKIGFLLSGGLDSSILFRLCQKNYNLSSTYSSGDPFCNPNKNVEKEYAISAASYFRTNHSYYELSVEDYLHGFLESIAIAEEPLHHLQSVILYLLFKNGIPDCHNIIISGMGADGIFGLGLHNLLFRSEQLGFGILTNSIVLQFLYPLKLIFGRDHMLTQILENLQSRHYPFSDPRSIIWKLGKYGDIKWVMGRFHVRENEIIKNRYESVSYLQSRSDFDMISLLSFLGSASVSTSIWSKLGESQRKIIYYPYMSIKLLEYVNSIPWRIKLAKSKNLLRNVGCQIDIPEFIMDRPKSGFGIALEQWAKDGGMFEPLISLASVIVEREQIKQTQSTNLGSAMVYWNILNYTIWKRLCIDNEPLPKLHDELTAALEGR